MSPERKTDPATGNKLVYGIEFYRVSSMPCCVCGTKGWWAHHVVPVGRGGEDRGNVVPLCSTHHQQLHKRGEKTFEADHEVDLADVAKKIWERKRNKW